MTDDTTAAASAAFDLASFEDVPSTDYVLKNPATGAPTAVVFSLAGPEHPTRKRAAMARARRMRAALMKTGKVQLGDPEEDEADETDQLVSFTLGWKGVVIGGKEVPFSAAAARDLYGDPKRRWVRDQVKAALEERDAFIRGSAGN